MEVEIKMKRTARIVGALFFLLLTVHPLWAEPDRKQDHSLFISAASLKYQMSKNTNIVVVDVRNKDGYGAVRLPGSMNIPLFSLKTKTFLKSKDIVVTNEGYSVDSLKSECESLVSSGFKVKILSGGLAAWKQKGNPLEGDPVKAGQINRVLPSEVFMEKNGKKRVCIDVSKDAGPSFQKSLRVKHIPCNVSMKSLKDFLKNRKRSELVTVLIANHNGQGYEGIEKQLSHEEMENVFFLEGGRKAYMAYLKEQEKMHAPKQDRQKQVEGCATCKDN